jgi:hypothetical protein
VCPIGKLSLPLSKFSEMATNIKAGMYQPPFTSGDENLSYMLVYIDDKVVQFLDEDEKFVCQFSYEELRGIMAIMAAEQEKTHLRIQAHAKKN